jgi:hypothetical protein
MKSPVLPCSPKAALWVRVRAAGQGLPGVKVDATGKSVDTDDAGFGAFEDVAVSADGHTVRISLSDELDKHYMLPAQAQVTRPVKAGQISLVQFDVAERARPVIEMAQDQVAVKGSRLPITLAAKGKFAGKGTLTCTGGDGKVRFFDKKTGASLAQPTATFADITEAGVEIEAEAIAHSDPGGIQLKWELDGDATRAAPGVTRKLTAVEAVLDVYKKSGTALDPGEKSGDGLVLHLQNGKKERRRARVTVTCKPAAFRGAVELAAIKPSLAVYTKGGDPVDLSKPIDVTSDDPLDLLVEGTATSAAKADTGLTLKIKDLSGSDPVDSAKLTVIETRVDLHAARVPKPPPAPFAPPPPPGPPGRDNPPLISADQKLDPGRTLALQSAGFAIQRAMVRVIKLPHDAPCKLTLRSPSTKNELALFPDAGTHARTDPKTSVVTNVPHSHENHTDGETAGAASMDIAHDAIKDAAAGLCFWVEGAKVSGGKVALQVDVDGVDEACDAVSFTVVQPTLEIKVVRSDGKVLDGDVDYEVKTRGKGLSVAKGKLAKGGTGAVTVPVDAGEYVIELGPKDVAEAKMRICRTTPATQEAAVAVKGPAVAAYKLSPPYEQIQPVAYRIRTGRYIGIDDPSRITTGSPAEKLAEALKQDLERRCAIMKDAIVYAAKKADADAKILKIFMAPEFYFRGSQGAYPLEMVSEILNVKSLKDEISKDDYKDWLFVLGSAIGTISLEGQAVRQQFAGTVTHVDGGCWLYVKCQTTLAVAAGWAFWYVDANGLIQWFDITDFQVLGTSGPEKTLAIRLDGDLKCAPQTMIGARSARVSPKAVTVDRKAIQLQVAAGTAPSPGWELEQNGVRGRVRGVSPISSGGFTLLVEVAGTETLEPGLADLYDGPTPHATTVNAVIGCRLRISYGAASSSVAAAAAGWHLMVQDSSGAWTVGPGRIFDLSRATPVGPGKLEVVLAGRVPLLPAGRTVGLVPQLLTMALTNADKEVDLKVDVASGTIAKGQYLEQDDKACAVVLSSKLLSGTTHAVVARIPSGLDTITSGKAIKFVDPGSVEIINVALVRKGGKDTPLRPDGGAGHELLVYKEWISSVDFRGMDYDGQTFYRTDRHAGEIQSDQSRRLVPTEGSRDVLGASPNVPGKAEWTEPSGKKHTVPTITEKSGSGLGGGSVFTMDDITFGLEVCLDHGQGKLENYYAGLTSGSGHPRVQVQLIPSCGMSISNRVCVPNGIIFNVDATHHAVEKDAGSSSRSRPTAATTDLVSPTSTDVDKCFETADPDAQTGKILTFAPIPVPTKATV